MTGDNDHQPADEARIAPFDSRVIWRRLAGHLQMECAKLENQGRLLPAQRRLAKQMGVSRVTAKAALGYLKQAGVIRAFDRHGYVINPIADWRVRP